jgi:hypothetical protein
MCSKNSNLNLKKNWIYESLQRKSVYIFVLQQNFILNKLFFEINKIINKN